MSDYNKLAQEGSGFLNSLQMMKKSVIAKRFA